MNLQISELRQEITGLMADGKARTVEAIAEAVGEEHAVIRKMLENMVASKEVKYRLHSHLKNHANGRPVREYVMNDPEAEWPLPDTSVLVASAMANRHPLELVWGAA